MDTIKITKNNTLMIAHRGLSGLERENTCAAFIAAAVKSYYGIETDVHVTKDGKYLICHDDNIERVTGVDMIIEDSLYDDLRKYPIFDFDLSTRSDLILPDLLDYILICKKYKKRSILELKNTMGINHIQNIVETIKQNQWYEMTTFISFSVDNVINLRNLYHDADIQFLTDRVDADIIKLLVDYHLGLDIHYRGLTKEVVDELHSLNITVNCWTVDSKEEAENLINMGVDMITSNILE